MLLSAYEVHALYDRALLPRGGGLSQLEKYDPYRNWTMDYFQPSLWNLLHFFLTENIYFIRRSLTNIAKNTAYKTYKYKKHHCLFFCSLMMHNNVENKLKLFILNYLCSILRYPEGRTIKSLL